jgi:hypothetical protein
MTAAVSLALVNGRIRTGDPRRPMADAMAVSGTVLALVGSSAEVRKLTDSATRVIDLRGAAVLAVPDGSVLRRGAPASFTIPDGANESAPRFRMIDGAIVVDLFAEAA